MSPATLTPPAADADAIQAPPMMAQPDVPVLPVRAPLRRDRGGRGMRVSRTAVAASLAAHAVMAVLLVLGINEARRQRQAATAAADAAATEQVSYLDVGEWPAGAPAAGGGQAGTTAAEQAVTAAAVDSVLARTPQIERFPDRVPTRIPPAGPGGRGGAPGAAPGAQPGAAGAGNGTGQGAGNGIGDNVAGGRYGAGYRDRRLIVRPEAVPERQRSDHERYMEHLNGRLGVYNDSVADEAARQRRARNWTVKDRNGREWGIGEGGTPVIAGRKIPIPLSPPVYVDRDQQDAAREAARRRGEIDRQIEAGERSQSVQESARRARERQDAERQRRRDSQRDTSRTSP
ncbi:MAG TPA: hypothetical protein VFS20_14830 [Longimicrobium sp.]|nr:hypothetical protein [Longimicrobium sp.]